MLRKRFRLNIACTLLLAVCILGILQTMNHFMIVYRQESSTTSTKCDCDSQPNEETRLNKQRRDTASASPSMSENNVTESFDKHFDTFLRYLEGLSKADVTRLGVNADKLRSVIAPLTEIRESRTKKAGTNAIPDQTKEKVVKGIQEICPEKFQGHSLDYGYPFFRKGFATVDCDQHVPLKDLITVVFDDVFAKASKPLLSYEKVLKGLGKQYSDLNVIYMTQKQRSVEKIAALKSNVEVMIVKKGVKQGAMWSDAVSKVSTKYVLIAPSMDTFDDDVNLERLIRVLSHNTQFMIAAGANRRRNGHWENGCQQSIVRDYTLTLQNGYYVSHGECVLCDYSPGPWVARTQELKAMQFDKSLDFGTFRDIFWKVKQSKKQAVSCPDVMFNIANPEDEDDARYLQFANKYELKKIVEANGRVRWFGCRRGIKHKHGNSCRRIRGMSVPPCDLENLADGVKLVMSECEKAGLFCELQMGTLLGAVKFNKVLPWERDADLTFLTANYTAFKELGPVFRAAGYSFSADDKSLWCCADNRQAGGKFKLSANGWNIDLYGQHLMESEMLANRGEAPTKVDFAGQMVTVVRNPGLFARNRYGERIYMHQEHWIDRGKKSGWLFYNPGKFEKCPVAGHSGCLSQYSVDGNMQFGKDICPCVRDT